MMNKFALAACAAAATIAGTTAASAAQYVFVFTGVYTDTGAADVYNLLLTTDSTGKVTAVSGDRNGTAATTLAPNFPSSFGGADQMLSATAPYVSSLGISLRFGPGMFGNVFSDSATQYEAYEATNLAGTAGVRHALGTLVVTPFAAAVPEPATWATLMVGFGLAGATLRRRAPRLAQAI